MNVTQARIALGLATFAGLTISFCSSLLYMSHLASAGLSQEIANAKTTIERRIEIAGGLENAVRLQIGISNIIWWLSLATIILILAVIFWGLKSK